MIKLNVITTKHGDQGRTWIQDGHHLIKVDKNHPRLNALGDIDELNSSLGVFAVNAKTSTTGLKLLPLVMGIMNELFDLGADLCMPLAPEQPPDKSPIRITESQVNSLEALLAERNESLAAQNSFLLPGGSPCGAALFLSRAICRRAERSVVALNQTSAVNPLVLVYLNRLSDLLFVWSRVLNVADGVELLWEPGKTATKP